MIERTRYIKDSYGNKYGVVTIIYNEGRFGAGMSLCNEDKFDKVVGKEMALKRAMENQTLLLKDLTQANTFPRFAKVTGCNIPLTSSRDYAMENKLYDAFGTFIVTVHDIIYTLALAKVKAETRG